MVLTFRAGKFAALAASMAAALAGLASCSREQQDWRSAEASDSVEAYSDFLKDHPDSSLVRQARARLTQLSEDRAWSQAGTADTVDAYKQFLAQYPNGKWSEEARIRVENFELGAAPAQPTSAQASIASAQLSGPVAPGEAAQLPTSPNDATVQSPRPSTYPVAAAAPFPSASAVNPSASGAASNASTSAATASAGLAITAAVASNASASAGTASTGLAPSPAPYSTTGTALSVSPTSSSTAGITTSASPTPSSMAGAWRSADPTSYGVQLGAFASENAATGQWQQLVERFDAQLRGLAPHVVSAETATGRLFRLQALVADEATARALCDMLRKQSQACVPVLPH